MLVRCEFIISPPSGGALPADAWLKAGSEYLAVGIVVDPGRQIDLRVVDDSGEPSLWPMAMFTVVDGHLTPEWAVLDRAGALVIEPKEFLRPGYWERYWDRDREARRLFSEFVERAVDAHKCDSDS